MDSEAIVGLLIRSLPAIAVVVLAFVAASDKKTRERWGNLLYQVGSIRPDQREDPKIGSGVKWPFFVVALGLLIWPIQYYRHVSRTIETTGSDLFQQPAAPQSDLTAPAQNSVTAANSVSNSASTPGPSGDLGSTPATSPPAATGTSDLSQPAAP